MQAPNTSQESRHRNKRILIGEKSLLSVKAPGGRLSLIAWVSAICGVDWHEYRSAEGKTCFILRLPWNGLGGCGVCEQAR